MRASSAAIEARRASLTPTIRTEIASSAPSWVTRSRRLRIAASRWRPRAVGIRSGVQLGLPSWSPPAQDPNVRTP